MKLKVYDSKNEDGDSVIAIEYDQEFADELAKTLKKKSLTKEQIHIFLSKCFDKFLCEILESGDKIN